MRQLSILFACVSIAFSLQAQTGCPGCVVDVPPGLAADTLYIQDLPDAEKGTYYDQDISFRMPMTTTPVHAVDSTIPSGLTISKIEIITVEGVPPGLHWQPNKWVFQTDTETDGCVKFCGTPSVSDTFTMTVRIKATVFFITQEATFPLKIYIAPKVVNTDGFTMSNVTGCGSTTVSFTNNVPSGGVPGFTYEWDFGDGTVYTGENPPPHLYEAPGVYPVKYHATVDTAGFVLESITVLEVGCVDQLGVGKPDLYLLINDPGGTEVFDSSPDVDNTPLPYNFPVNLPLGSGNYTLAVWDEDSGLKGTDDPCGTISFNILSNDTLVAGDLTVVLNIVHEVDEIMSVDTVIVYPQPPMPFIQTPHGLSACAGEDTILLVSSAGAGNQWWHDGTAIPGATDFIYEPSESGYFQVQVNTSYGCTAISDSVLVEIHDLPNQPVFVNINNSLRLADTMSLPASYALQWYNGDDPIPGATGFRYCATVSGDYGLQVTDLETGCTNFYAAPVVYNPDFDCTVGIGEAPLAALGIFPNPVSDVVNIHLDRALQGTAILRLWDVTGRLIATDHVEAGTDTHTLSCGHIANGSYLLEISSGDFRAIAPFVVLH
ncbi:MAG: T9SS type A sorting domain-containing protein [Saprospiraceae bacterium]|nr:T9SS type A sorting domain-containing protein [Saprospiraceae bacterium]